MSRGFDGLEIDDFHGPERDASRGSESNRRAGWDAVRRLERIRGEEEREMGFRTTMRERSPGRALVEATDTDGIDTAVRDQTIAILREHPDVAAVYSIGGGNRAIGDRSTVG